MSIHHLFVVVPKITTQSNSLSLVHTGIWWMLSLVVATGVFAVFTDFVLTHSCCYQWQQPEFSYLQDAAMSENSVYMGDSDTVTSKFAEKLNSFNFIQRLASASGLQRISVQIGIWIPIAASETSVFNEAG